jgi:hypothetical protein
MMKDRIILLLLLFIVLSCAKEECAPENKRLAAGGLRLDSNVNSPFFRQTVLDFYYSWMAKVECKNVTCLEMRSMQVANVSSKDMDLTLSLAGRGDFTFSIPKGDTIQISPLPDYCIGNTWGTVKEIKYK